MKPTRARRAAMRYEPYEKQVYASQAKTQYKAAGEMSCKISKADDAEDFNEESTAPVKVNDRKTK